MRGRQSRDRLRSDKMDDARLHGSHLHNDDQSRARKRGAMPRVLPQVMFRNPSGILLVRYTQKSFSENTSCALRNQFTSADLCCCGTKSTPPLAPQRDANPAPFTFRKEGRRRLCDKWDNDGAPPPRLSVVIVL